MGYNYLAGLDETNNLLLLALSIPLTAFGVFLIYKTGRLDLDKAKMEKIIQPLKGIDGKNIIEKNNKMVKEWVNSTETADKLKILGMEAEEKKK